MTNRNLGRWLLVALAIVGLAFAAPIASAHGDDPVQENGTAVDGMPADDDVANEWTVWMDDHMTEVMGPDGVNEMESHMGVTVDEMAQDMQDGTYTTMSDGTTRPDDTYTTMSDGTTRPDGTYTTTGMNGRGYGC